MIYHFLAPEGGHTTRDESFIEKLPNCKDFFLNHSSKPNQQKQKDVLSKSAANTYQPNKYHFFPINLLLTHHEALFNLNIVLSFHSLLCQSVSIL